MHRVKADHILFAVIVISILLINVFSLDNNCYWGDDFAAYISEGISIADGYFDELKEHRSCPQARSPTRR